MSEQPGQATSKVDLTAWCTVAVLLVMYILSLVDRQIIALMVTPLRRDLGLSDVQIGLLEGLAFAVMYTTAAIPLGWAIDRYSRRLVVFLGVMCWSISCAGAGFANSFVALFASRVGVGLGEASLTPASHSILGDLFPRNQLSLALGVFAIGANLGVMISYGLGGTIIHSLEQSGDIVWPIVGQIHTWQAAFLIAGAPGLFAAFLMFAIREPPRKHVTQSADSFFKPLVAFFKRHPVALATMFLGFALNNMLGYSILGWTPAFLQRRFGWEIGTIGPVLGLLLGGAGVVAMLFAGFMANRFYRKGRHDISFRAAICSLLIIAPLSVGAFLAPTPMLSLAALTIVYMLAAASVPSAAAALQLIAPGELRGRLAASYLFVSNIAGQGLGPLIVGFTTEHVFKDPALVGHSLAVVIPSAALLGALLLIVGLKAFQGALVASDRGASPQPEHS